MEKIKMTPAEKAIKKAEKAAQIESMFKDNNLYWNYGKDRIKANVGVLKQSDSEDAMTRILLKGMDKNAVVVVAPLSPEDRTIVVSVETVGALKARQAWDKALVAANKKKLISAVVDVLRGWNYDDAVAFCLGMKKKDGSARLEVKVATKSQARLFVAKGKALPKEKAVKKGESKAA